MAGLPIRAANTASMDDPLRHSAPGRLVERRVESKGLRPRVAASVIAVLWLIAIAVFGVLERLADPDSFDTVWDGMWWATQTVTTVGYGDVVPDGTAGRLIATVLMVGGLSFFAVITGVITSVFVTRAQAERRRLVADSMDDKLDVVTAELAEIREQLARLGRGDARRPPG
jgi:voltage-gated potassium channel Kch